MSTVEHVEPSGQPAPGDAPVNLGADVCELAPTLDPVGSTATNAANLRFEAACLVAAGLVRRR